MRETLAGTHTYVQQSETRFRNSGGAVSHRMGVAPEVSLRLRTRQNTLETRWLELNTPPNSLLLYYYCYTRSTKTPCIFSDENKQNSNNLSSISLFHFPLIPETQKHDLYRGVSRPVRSHKQMKAALSQAYHTNFNDPTKPTRGGVWRGKPGEGVFDSSPSSRPPGLSTRTPCLGTWQGRHRCPISRDDKRRLRHGGK